MGVFTYSHEEGTSAFALEDDVPAPERSGRGATGSWACRSGSSGGGSAAGLASVARILVDGPSGDHELVLKGRLTTQAPDIDAAVYLTECDPSSLRRRRFCRGRNRRLPRLRPDRAARPEQSRGLLHDSGRAVLSHAEKFAVL